MTDGEDRRVAIVVATRNRREQLLRTMPLHLGLAERPRVVVVDNASTDGTVGALRTRHPAVHVIRAPRNLGGAGRNLGLRAVDSPYVALCDDDSWWAPGALRRAADLLDRHPALGVIAGHILVGAQRRVDPVCHDMARSVLPPDDGQPGRPLLSFLACAAVVRREAVLGAGGFDERLEIGGEEELLAWDLAAAGWLMSYVPEVVAHHDPPPNDGRPERRVRALRNALWVTWLRTPARAVAGRTYAQVRRGRSDRVSMRAVASAVAGLPWVLRERRAAPPRVERMRRLLEERPP